MSSFVARVFLLIAGVLYFAVPYVFSRIRWQGTVYPDTPPGFAPGYGLFIDQQIIPPPGFNLIYFIVACIVAAFLLIFLLFPQLFGFKPPVNPPAPPPKVSFPPWFWPSFVVWIAAWIIMWARWPKPLDLFTFIPLWWGFIFTVDGLVYRRNNGISMLSNKPNILKVIFAFSSVAWFSFEYINFFVVELWYYPNNKIFTNFGYIFWYLLSFTVVWTGIFEVYTLIKTIPSLRYRWADGPKITLSKKTLWFLFGLGLVSFALMGLMPRLFFPTLWAAPLLTVGASLGIIGTWTHFTPITKGDWSPAILIALAALANGFVYELWNEGSQFFSPIADNPNYWKYAVPYIDVLHIFSQMPLLGYFGYLFFGNIVWVIWIFGARLMNFPSDFDDTEVP